MRKMIVKAGAIALIGMILVVSLPIKQTKAQTDNVYLAYVHEGVLKLADAEGMPIAEPGPVFQTAQGANIFWSSDGERLFIARRDGMFVTGPGGGASSKLPGNYGITVTFDRTGDVIYSMESTNPLEAESSPDYVTFPLRESNQLQNEGGTGRLVGYIGEYAAGSSNAVVNAAALQYARDGGLVVVGRPRLFPTYGATMFYSCCFPDPGLNAIDLPSGEKRTYDSAFIAGPASINSSRSRLAGPTTTGLIRVIDLVTAGVRDYVADIGTIERIAWALDDSAIYIVSRQNPLVPLELNPIVTAPIDTSSASIVVWRLDLVSGRLSQLAQLGDYYGVSSMAVTTDYIFLVAVERNSQLVDDLNAGRLPQDIDPLDPRLLNDYLTQTILFRVALDGREALSVMADVWGVAARPRH